MNFLRSPPTLVLFCFLLLGCAHQRPKNSSQDLTAKISNVDIQWDGNIAGLWPTITGPSKTFLTNSDPSIVPALIESLTDQHRYIAAHVLLTIRSHEQFELTASHWNGLRIELLADNSILIPTGQQPHLIKKWTQWHAANPKPNN